MHLLIETFIGGVVYSGVEPLLPGKPVIKGITFGFIIWIAMAFFVVAASLQVAVAALVMSLVYGATLGIVYANLGRAAVREDVTSE